MVSVLRLYDVEHKLLAQNVLKPYPKDSTGNFLINLLQTFITENQFLFFSQTFKFLHLPLHLLKKFQEEVKKNYFLSQSTKFE